MTSAESTSSLQGHRVVVTGAASGIGAACARAFSAASAELTLVDRDAEAVEAVAQELGAKSLAADLSDLARLEELEVDADVLINNAGFQTVAPLEEFPLATFNAMVTVMLTAPFALAQKVLPGMYGRGWGRVVNISSIHGSRASLNKAAYVAAKHGLEGLSKVIALEGGPRGVTSNCISPSYVRTPLVDAQIAAQASTLGIEEDDVVRDVMLAKTAIKRLIEPTEVAELALYLCGPSSGMVNGTSVAMDGGWTAQ